MYIAMSDQSNCLNLHLFNIFRSFSFLVNFKLCNFYCFQLSFDQLLISKFVVYPVSSVLFHFINHSLILHYHYHLQVIIFSTLAFPISTVSTFPVPMYFLFSSCQLSPCPQDLSGQLCETRNSAQSI